MKHKNLVLAAVMTVFTLVGPQSSTAQSDNQVITGLLNMPLSDIAGKESNVVLFEVGPGWNIASHSHPGHIFVYMLEGSLKIEVDGHQPETLNPGDVVYEIPNLNMVCSNTSSSEGAKFVVFTVGDIGAPVTVFAE